MLHLREDVTAIGGQSVVDQRTALAGVDTKSRGVTQAQRLLLK